MTTRGFETAEYQARLARAQSLMQKAGLGAFLLTTEPDIRYFTGYLTRFWESPTRPWFLIVPASGDPIAVIPAIGADLMAKTWLTDIRTWHSPDVEDDGVSLLAETLRECGADEIGIPSGPATHVRMPLADLERLRKALHPATVRDDAGIMRRLRMVKSDAEVAKIAHACSIAAKAFDTVPDFARPGVPLDTVFRQFQMACLEAGADWVSYLAGGSGPDGYADVISPATPEPLQDGHVLMLDTGAVWDGYFCDFDRNFAVGPATEKAKSAHVRLLDAIEAGCAAAHPGVAASDVFHAMDRVLTGGKAPPGRLGHGLGMQLTEWPSLMANDRTMLEDGMVLTLEPVIETAGGRIMVHEDNIVVRAGGPKRLTRPAPMDLPELS